MQLKTLIGNSTLLKQIELFKNIETRSSSNLVQSLFLIARGIFKIFARLVVL